MDQRMTRYAEKKAGTHNKFYEVEALREEDATHCQIIFRWGRIGTTGQTKVQTCLAWSTAVSTCNEQFEKKLKRGYKEVCAMQALASAIQDPTERKSEGGLDPVQIPTPRFGVTGSTKTRLERYCQKYLDKLNVIRDSRRTLGFRAYETQFLDLLDSYDREWVRISETKAHGSQVRNERAREGYRAFRHDLRANAGINLAFNRH